MQVRERKILLKICYLTEAGSVHAHKWVNYFKEKGHQVFVISLGEKTMPGVRVYNLNAKALHLSDWGKLRAYTRHIKRAREIVYREKPDVIHAHYATSYGILAARLNIHPYILSVWGSDVYQFPESGLFQQWLLRYNLKKADVILSTSEAMKKRTGCFTNKDILVTPFGVDPNFYIPKKDRDQSNSFTVGTVKSFYKIYGIDDLIRGFALFVKKNTVSDARLLLGGRGDEEENLKKLVSELGMEKRVDFLGYLSPEKVVEAFNRMDVAVFPSKQDSESFGVAAVEAQACGCACIVSDVGGLPEATKEGYSSLVVPESQPQAIAEALTHLYQDRNLLKKMQKQARQYVLENYVLSENFKLAEKIYDHNTIRWED